MSCCSYTVDYSYNKDKRVRVILVVSVPVEKIYICENRCPNDSVRSRDLSPPPPALALRGFSERDRLRITVSCRAKSKGSISAYFTGKQILLLGLRITVNGRLSVLCLTVNIYLTNKPPLVSLTLYPPSYII